MEREDEGKECSDATISPQAKEVWSGQKLEEGFHPRASEGAQSWDALIQDFQSWEPCEKTLLCFNPQGHGNLQQQL